MSKRGSLFLWHLKLEGRTLFERDCLVSTLLTTLRPFRSFREECDEYSDLLQHLGGEESAYATDPRRALARRAAFLSVELTHIEDLVGQLRVQGKVPEDAILDLYLRMTGVYSRTLEKLGLDRHARDCTPDPLTYARQQARKAEDLELEAEELEEQV